MSDRSMRSPSALHLEMARAVERAMIAAGQFFPVGTRVTYADEDPANPEIVGVIVEPTAEESIYCRLAAYPDPVGPDAGGVVVQWDGEAWNRAWHLPSDLICLPEETS